MLRARYQRGCAIGGRVVCQGWRRTESGRRERPGVRRNPRSYCPYDPCRQGAKRVVRLARVAACSAICTYLIVPPAEAVAEATEGGHPLISRLLVFCWRRGKHPRRCPSVPGGRLATVLEGGLNIETFSLVWQRVLSRKRSLMTQRSAGDVRGDRICPTTL